MKSILFPLLLMFVFSTNGVAQNSGAKPSQEIDPTKPTNLYTQVNANMELESGKNQDLYGFRANVQYAFNPDNLLLLELPLLYSDQSGAFGVGDMRVRYFNAVKRKISKSFIAIAPFADVSVPLGSYKNGLGTSNWSIAGGIVCGFILSKELSFFPGASYVHITKPSTDLIPEMYKFVSNGVGLQFNVSYSINKKTFLFINPTPSFMDTNGDWKTYWSGELNLNRIITPNKFKVNAYWGPNFTTELHIFRIGATFYL